MTKETKLNKQMEKKSFKIQIQQPQEHICQDLDTSTNKSTNDHWLLRSLLPMLFTVLVFITRICSEIAQHHIQQREFAQAIILYKEALSHSESDGKVVMWNCTILAAEFQKKNYDGLYVPVFSQLQWYTTGFEIHLTHRKKNSLAVGQPFLYPLWLNVKMLNIFYLQFNHNLPCGCCQVSFMHMGCMGRFDKFYISSCDQMQVLKSKRSWSGLILGWLHVMYM